MWGKRAPFTVMDINNLDGRWSTLGHTMKSTTMRHERGINGIQGHNGDDNSLSAVRPPLTSRPHPQQARLGSEDSDMCRGAGRQAGRTMKNPK